jgi:ParB-like chromosome segregation protein Spo0J
MTLKIEYKPVADLIPYAKNSRTHTDAQVAQIAASIKEFGWTNPILLDGDNNIIAGHGRVLAALKLGEKLVPTINLAYMTQNQQRAYIIADNKLALNAGWNNEMLALEIADLKDASYDLGLTGFSVDEIELMGKDVNFDAATEEEQGKLDELDPKWITCPHCEKEFDARQA